MVKGSENPSGSVDGTSQRKRRATTPMVNVNDDLTGGVERKAAGNQDSVYEEMLASAIIRHGYPLTYSELCGVNALHTYLNPNVKQISGKVSNAQCLKVYESEKDKLKQALGSIAGRVCLTCDVWADPCTLEYLCLTLNFVNCKWKLQSKFLNLVELPFPWDAASLESQVYDLLCQWGIEKRILTVTLNSGRCGDTALEMLRDHLNQDGALLCHGDYFHVRCGANFMDRMVDESFKLIDSSIRKLREGIHYVVGHEKNRLKFEEAAKLVDKGAQESLWSDCHFRWNSTYLMLERAIKYRPAFEVVMIGDDYTGWHLMDEKWSRVEKICKLLKPLYDIAKLFLGTEHPTANLYFGKVWETGMNLLEALEDSDLDIRNMAQKLKTEFDDYWESYNTVLAFAVAFDPRYKLHFVKFCYENLDKASAEDRYVCIRNRLDRLFKVYREQRLATIDIAKLDRFEKWRREQELLSTRSNLDVYLDQPLLDHWKQLDALSWWEQNQDHFDPELSLMARDILSIPITSFSKDSVFGMGYRLHDRLKGSWSSNCTEALVATRNWLYGYVVNEDYSGGLMGLEQHFWITKIASDSDSD